MSATNPNWDRWILASVSDHFDVVVRSVFSLPFFVEGQHRDTNKQSAWFELRVDGPIARERPKNCWSLRVEVNCLISTSMNDFDFHVHRQNAGNVSTGFHNCIKVFRYGDGDNDDDSLVDVLKLRDDVVTTHFGQISPDVKLQQTTVEGHYEMLLTT